VEGRLAELRDVRVPVMQTRRATLELAAAVELRFELRPALDAIDRDIAGARLRSQVFSNVGALRSVIDSVQDRASKLQDLYSKLVTNGFKSHVYNTRVLPAIESRMNAFISDTCNHTAFSVRITSTVSRIQFGIHMGGRGTAVTSEGCIGLDHASGYQRFVVALAMRVALVKLGATRCGLRHMFMDEVFTACDSNNITMAGDLLRDLVAPAAASVSAPIDSIVIMSHLEAIRDAAHIHVPVVVRGGLGVQSYSTINFE
jgi:DNA repair exonuclease SbcCD ATPase subunit